MAEVPPSGEEGLWQLGRGKGEAVAGDPPPAAGRVAGGGSLDTDGEHGEN